MCWPISDDKDKEKKREKLKKKIRETRRFIWRYKKDIRVQEILWPRCWQKDDKEKDKKMVETVWRYKGVKKKIRLISIDLIYWKTDLLHYLKWIDLASMVLDIEKPWQEQWLKHEYQVFDLKTKIATAFSHQANPTKIQSKTSRNTHCHFRQGHVGAWWLRRWWGTIMQPPFPGSDQSPRIECRLPPEIYLHCWRHHLHLHHCHHQYRHNHHHDQT